VKFGPIPAAEAAGKILGHNIADPDGRRALRKGRALTDADVATLAQMGRTTVYVAEVEPGDIDENNAAAQIAAPLVGPGLRLSGPATGRINLVATALALLRVDAPRLAQLNNCPGVTLATLPAHSPVTSGRTVATLKILPYYLPETTVAQAAEIAAEPEPLLRLDPLPARRVGLILSGSPAAQAGITHSFESALERRLAALGSSIVRTDFVPLEEFGDEAALVETLIAQRNDDIDMVILAGETAIMDRYDIAPRAVEQAGGEVVCFGAPVDPGNLLMLANWGQMPILGAPGCARSPKKNIVDLVLPRLLAGDALSVSDIVALGHGGLLEDVPERPAPRSRLG